jgi:hypothetical protein
MHRVLRGGGQLTFSVYHPDLAAAGIEANFRSGGEEFRLGAVTHTEEDYRRALQSAGFETLESHEFVGDERLSAAVPNAKKYQGSPLLLVLTASRPA